MSSHPFHRLALVTALAVAASSGCSLKGLVLTPPTGAKAAGGATGLNKADQALASALSKDLAASAAEEKEMDALDLQLDQPVAKYEVFQLAGQQPPPPRPGGQQPPPPGGTQYPPPPGGQTGGTQYPQQTGTQYPQQPPQQGTQYPQQPPQQGTQQPPQQGTQQPPQQGTQQPPQQGTQQPPIQGGQQPQQGGQQPMQGGQQPMQGGQQPPVGGQTGGQQPQQGSFQGQQQGNGQQGFQAIINLGLNISVDAKAVARIATHVQGLLADTTRTQLTQRRGQQRTQLAKRLTGQDEAVGKCKNALGSAQAADNGDGTTTRSAVLDVKRMVKGSQVNRTVQLTRVADAQGTLVASMITFKFTLPNGTIHVGRRTKTLTASGAYAIVFERSDRFPSKHSVRCETVKKMAQPNGQVEGTGVVAWKQDETIVKTVPVVVTGTEEKEVVTATDATTAVETKVTETADGTVTAEASDTGAPVATPSTAASAAPEPTPSTAPSAEPAHVELTVVPDETGFVAVDTPVESTPTGTVAEPSPVASVSYVDPAAVATPTPAPTATPAPAASDAGKTKDCSNKTKDDVEGDGDGDCNNGGGNGDTKTDKGNGKSDDADFVKLDATCVDAKGSKWASCD